MHWVEICVSLLRPLSSNVRDMVSLGFFAIASVIEMHTFLVTLVRQFDFSLPDDEQKIRLVGTSSITPMVVGEENKGPQMPLKVTAIGSEQLSIVNLDLD